MGEALSKDVEETAIEPDSSHQSPNAPEIQISSSYLSKHENKTPSQIIQDFLQTSIYLVQPHHPSLVPSHDGKGLYLEKSVDQKPQSTVFQKNVDNHNHQSTATTNESENEHIEKDNTNSQNNNNSPELSIPSPDVDLKETKSELEKDEELITISEEPIKTMAGSLLKDIRQVYKFKDVLGGGHFGTVRIGFRRQDPSPRRLYAIKSISKKHLTKKDLDELTKEVDIISSLDHPNIIKFYETYHDQFYFHIVMELCRGKDLFERMMENNGKIIEKKVAIIIMKVLHAISYCHSRGITHRDLKPENILFESSELDAEIKLIDFGLSRKYLSHEKMHTILGTPYYVAPEVLRGSYDEKCDIWSIGALTYLMLCGEPPFKGCSNNDIFKKILTNELKFDQRKWKNVSEEAIDFVKRCLDKNPEKRPSASQALCSDWFGFLLTRVHSSLCINKEILLTIKRYTPCCKFKKYVLKYFINMMSHSEIRQYKVIFYAADFDHDGTVDKRELEEAFKLSGINVTKEEIKKIFSASDDVDRQTLDYSEFITVCLDLKKIVTKEKIENAFNYFDINNSGLIEADDIKNALLRFGKKIVNEEDIYKMIREVSKKDKKDISFQEFKSIFPCFYSSSGTSICAANGSSEENSFFK